MGEISIADLAAQVLAMRAVVRRMHADHRRRDVARCIHGLCRETYQRCLELEREFETAQQAH